jgi:hypothetical protein
VLSTNKSMLKVFQKGDHPIQTKLQDGAYALTIRFNPEPE